MQTSKVDHTIKSVKNFINFGLTQDGYNFDKLALQLYYLHHEMNDPYYQLCNRKIPTTIEDIPLVPLNLFVEDNKIGITFDTEMPFPGVMFNNDNLFHYMRDTELSKDSISRTFTKMALNEMSWVPWINFISFYNNSANDYVGYVLKYLSEAFHGSCLSNIKNVGSFSDVLIEQYGEDEEKVTIPTVLVAEEKTFIQIIADEHKEQNALPLGSRVLEIRSEKSSDSLLSVKSIINLFELNEISRMLFIPGISSQFYANIKRPAIDYCLKNNVKIETEYFANHWVKFRIVNSDTLFDVNPGEIGQIAIYDLANVWSCPFILTNNYGRVGNNGGLVFEDGN